MMTQDMIERNRIAAMIWGMSLERIEVTIRVPSPGIEKTVSTIIVPPSRMLRLVPSMVMIGSKAFLSACFQMTTFSSAPFERAVRM